MLQYIIEIGKVSFKIPEKGWIKAKICFFYINRFIIIIIVSTLSLVLFCIRIAFQALSEAS